MKKVIKIIALCLTAIILVLSISSCGEQKNKYVEVIVEGFDPFVLELYTSEAPITVAHFVELVEKGEYNGSYINRYQAGFVLQGGVGATSSTIKGEFALNGVKNEIKHEKGVISMARSDNYDSASNQFFIVTDTNASVTDSLDGKYAAFGKIVKGIEVLDQITKSITSDMYMQSIYGIYMGFLDSSHYIKITSMKVVEKP